jgi:hypothetical protein
MNDKRYNKKYGVDRTDPVGYDGLGAPVNNFGGFDHPPVPRRKLKDRFRGFLRRDT